MLDDLRNQTNPKSKPNYLYKDSSQEPLWWITKDGDLT